jgi:hypothetical protein
MEGQRGGGSDQKKEPISDHLASSWAMRKSFCSWSWLQVSVPLRDADEKREDLHKC